MLVFQRVRYNDQLVDKACQINFEPFSLMLVFEPKHFALAKPQHAKMGIMVFDPSNAENCEGFGWPMNSWVLGLCTFHVGTSAHR